MKQASILPASSSIPRDIVSDICPQPRPSHQQETPVRTQNMGMDPTMPVAVVHYMHGTLSASYHEPSHRCPLVCFAPKVKCASKLQVINARRQVWRPSSFGIRNPSRTTPIFHHLPVSNQVLVACQIRVGPRFHGLMQQVHCYGAEDCSALVSPHLQDHWSRHLGADLVRTTTRG